MVLAWFTLEYKALFALQSSVMGFCNNRLSNFENCLEKKKINLENNFFLFLSLQILEFLHTSSKMQVENTKYKTQNLSQT